MCGIFGIINPEPKSFDKKAFLTLGVNNDSRGGDSCGVFIDGQVEYGYNKKKLFEDFWPESELINKTKSCRIALGHCRKASVGGVGINDEKAQPVVIKDEEGNIKFVLTHNGTIRNYEDLAKKYIPDIDIKGMTDSQVMARIFYHAGYNVLGEYIGAGAFVIADYREGDPKILLFRGESKAYPASVNVTEERPLYFVNHNKSIIYSSIPTFLKTLFYNDELYFANANLLIECKEGDLKIVKEYDRTELYQNVSSGTTVRTYNKNLAYGYNGRTMCDDYYEDDVDYNRGSGSGGNAQSTGFQGTQKTQKTSPEKALIIPPKSEPTKVHKLTDPADINSYIIGNSQDLKYYIKGVPVTGTYRVTDGGLILSSTTVISKSYNISFFLGVPMYNKECLDFLLALCDSWDCTQEQLLEIYPDLVYYLSPFPFKDSRFTKSCLIYKMDTEEFKSIYTGKIMLMFTDWYNSCDKGIQSTVRIVSDTDLALKAIEDLKSFEVPKELYDTLLIQYENN